MTEEQINQIIKGQNVIAEGIDKLLSLFTLEPLNEATNPILGIGEVAKLLGTTRKVISEACRKNEIPYRQIGSRYFFSRVALMAWLHNVNMSYLFEKMEDVKKRNAEKFFGRKEDPTVHIENWIRFTINPVLGANEEFKLQFTEPKEEEVEIIDPIIAAELLGVSVGKMREWAHGFLYYKTPVIREGSKFLFKKQELLEWANTPTGKKLKDDYIMNSTLLKERQKAAEERREAERLEKEAKKRERLEKKLAAGGLVKGKKK